MPYFVNCSISQISRTTEDNEVAEYLNSSLPPGSDPVVAPLVLDAKAGTKCGTFVYKAKSKKAGRRALNALKESEKYLDDEKGGRSLPLLSSSCLGLNVIAGSYEDPAFECVLVTCIRHVY